MRVLVASLLLFASLLAGCSTSDSGDDGGSSSQTGTVGFAVSDAPTDEFAKIDVTISRVAIHRSNGGSDGNGTTSSGMATTSTNATATDTASSTMTTDASNGTTTAAQTSGAGWITIVSTAHTVDLLALHRNDTAKTLGFADVAAGHYQQVRFHVDSVVGTKTDGTKVNMTVPSGVVRTSGSFQVTAGGNTTIHVEIDLDRSVNCNPQGCRFQPHLGKVEARDS